jgi:hypothetical protein
MMLDVFKSDAFGLMPLVAAINKFPYAPTRLGSMGLFSEEGVSSLSVAIEMQNGVLTLVPAASRGAPGVAKGLERRNVRDFRTTHLPQRVAVMADEVQGLRAFGKETEEEVAMAYLEKKLAVARRDLDITHEWQRMGCLKGQVLDADASTVLYNYFTEFGVAQSTASWALSVTNTKVLQLCLALKRQIEDKLGGVMSSGIRVLCSAEFFDALTNHAAVVEAHKYQQSNVLRDDQRDGFQFGNIWFEEYRGAIGATRFIAANKAYAIPMGVPDLFKTFYSPAPYNETVNTQGLPFYAKRKTLDYDTGLDVQVQSNPLHINTRPDSVVELTAT